MIVRTANGADPIRRVTIYAASSGRIARPYFDAASALGGLLAETGVEIMYGGGRTGLMGAMADAALAAGGRVHGVTPGFLRELELSHETLTSLTVVNDMRERKHLMLEQSDAVIALPGGCGTYEELFEALTLKRLGRWLGPIVLLNTGGFYQPLRAALDHAVSEGFMDQRHMGMWTLVAEPRGVIPALRTTPAWDQSSLEFATAVGPAAS